ncbi:DUF1566 domain-containing protein, partial [Myxococcota bacterium]
MYTLAVYNSRRGIITQPAKLLKRLRRLGRLERTLTHELVHWVNSDDDCGTCEGNWDLAQNCTGCLGNWVDNSDDCGTCPPNWDGGQDCNACLADWSGEFCEKVNDCTGQPDFTLCELDTSPNDYYYDICVQGTCTSPGCDIQNCNAPGPHFTLADSGQRFCYNETGEITCQGTAGGPSCATTIYCGQDYQYGWDVTNPASNRYNRHEEVAGQPVVVDLVTGLVWQGCADDRSRTDCQIESTGGRTWLETLNYCDGLDWGGFTDWHLPDEYELLSIVDYNNAGSQAIDSGAFPQTSPEHFWTSSTAHSGQANAVAIEFGSGSLTANHGKDGTYHFRCVRNGPQVAGGAVGERFTVDNTTVPGEPVVADNVTGLEWQGCVDGRSGSGCTGDPVLHNWIDALAHCQGLDWGNRTDWYLPNIKQLHSITDNRAGAPAIDGSVFPNTPATNHWSSTTIAGEVAKAWSVIFDIGCVHGDADTNKADANPVRCVRDGL